MDCQYPSSQFARFCWVLGPIMWVRRTYNQFPDPSGLKTQFSHKGMMSIDLAQYGTCKHDFLSATIIRLHLDATFPWLLPNL